jgi:hypothetical protein
MRGAVLYGSRGLRFEGRDVLRIMKPTDVIVGITAQCVGGRLVAVPRHPAGQTHRADEQSLARE